MIYSHLDWGKPGFGLMADASRRMSIMQVIYSLQVGGSEKLALEISSHLDLKQFKPSVCALDLGGELAKDLEKNNIDYHVLHRRGSNLTFCGNCIE